MTTKNYRQYSVDFGMTPTVFNNKSFRMWEMCKEDLLFEMAHSTYLANNWRPGTDVRVGDINSRKYHPTAISRSKAALPMRKMLQKCDYYGIHRSLYYGMGRDFAGFKLLEGHSDEVIGYDPYHPAAEFRRKPRKQFDAIWLIYVLNVLSYEEGFRVLVHCHSLMKDLPTSRLYVAVRGDIQCS